MKVSKNFDLREFVSPGVYRKWGDSSIWFLDQRVITLAQFIRDRFNYSGMICNWHWWYKGCGFQKYQYSGFRSPSCTIGAKLGQHRFGRGLDYKMMGKPNNGADELREDIEGHFSMYKERGLTTIEHRNFAPTWCHMDTRWTGIDELFIVKP
ncbi:hypothetical protein LCGC14_0245280 [marine sediment metagenome]|uniref:Peptidase M15A C-terminal domain-containing protein n=1 Tax=marine sediment metagenome TaxID=412755 RepID=A0A0F9UM97_9ZZZZ